MYTKTIFFMLFILPLSALSQAVEGSYQSYIKNITSSLNQIFSSTYNPSCSIDATSNQLSMMIEPSKMNLNELDVLNLVLLQKINTDFSLSGSLSGIVNDKMNEISFNFSFASKLHDFFDVGIKSNFNMLKIKNENSLYSVQFGFGCNYHFTKDCSFAIVADNINRGNYPGSDRTIHQSLTFGVGSSFLKNLNMETGVMIDVNNNSSTYIIFEPYYHDLLRARIGYKYYPQTFTIGISLKAMDFLHLFSDENYINNFGFSERYGAAFTWD